jgi:deoxyuridine 5'-triphosphate nucleotidohydrolase
MERNNDYYIGALSVFQRIYNDVKVVNNNCSLRNFYNIYENIPFQKSTVYGTGLLYYFEVNVNNTNFESYEITWDFVCGVVDASSVLLKTEDLKLEIFSENRYILEKLMEFIKLPGTISNENILIYESVNVLDLFGNIKNSLKYEEFKNLLKANNPYCPFYKNDPVAIIPSKARLSDAGYDISIIKKHKQLTSNTILFDTGISLKIPIGFYVEVVPRSSLSKSGWMLANSVGIIDVGYRGNIYIALTKTCPDAIDIENQLPFRCCQLLFKKQWFVDMIEENPNNSIGTSRDKGGYGSTGV